MKVKIQLVLTVIQCLYICTNYLVVQCTVLTSRNKQHPRYWSVWILRPLYLSGLPYSCFCPYTPETDIK